MKESSIIFFKSLYIVMYIVQLDTSTNTDKFLSTATGRPHLFLRSQKMKPPYESVTNSVSRLQVKDRNHVWEIQTGHLCQDSRNLGPFNDLDSYYSKLQ